MKISTATQRPIRQTTFNNAGNRAAIKAAHTRKWRKAQEKAARTAKWAVTMTKVRIRGVLARTRWQLVTFLGKAKSESAGVVDLLAIRKDHSNSGRGMKRGDALQIILVQVKGGSAAMPTFQDGTRLRAVYKLHHARKVLLGSWHKGTAVKFFCLRRKPDKRWRDWKKDWRAVKNLAAIFR